MASPSPAPCKAGRSCRGEIEEVAFTAIIFARELLYMLKIFRLIILGTLIISGSISCTSHSSSNISTSSESSAKGWLNSTGFIQGSTGLSEEILDQVVYGSSLTPINSQVRVFSSPIRPNSYNWRGGSFNRFLPIEPDLLNYMTLVFVRYDCDSIAGFIKQPEHMEKVQDGDSYFLTANFLTCDIYKVYGFRNDTLIATDLYPPKTEYTEMSEEDSTRTIYFTECFERMRGDQGLSQKITNQINSSNDESFHATRNADYVSFFASRYLYHNPTDTSSSGHGAYVNDICLDRRLFNDFTLVFTPRKSDSIVGYVRQFGNPAKLWNNTQYVILFYDIVHIFGDRLPYGSYDMYCYRNDSFMAKVKYNPRAEYLNYRNKFSNW
jgi:hypothetical protein